MKAIRSLNVPMGAGVSGPTARTMNSAQMFGVDGLQARKVRLGYLLPIQAHIQCQGDRQGVEYQRAERVRL